MFWSETRSPFFLRSNKEKADAILTKAAQEIDAKYAGPVQQLEGDKAALDLESRETALHGRRFDLFTRVRSDLQSTQIGSNANPAFWVPLNHTISWPFKSF